MEANEIVMSGLQLKKLIVKKAEPIMREYDLRPVELDILVFLNKEKSIDTSKGIMHRTHLSKAHVSKSIENLHMREFIRLSEDEQDHRIWHISLTEKAGEVVEKVVGVYAECRQIIQDGIREDELVVVQRVLNRMNDNMNRELGEL